MGYEVTIEESTAFIREANLTEAYERMMRLNDPENDHLKTGGRSRGGVKVAVWYAWMPESFEDFKNAEDILQELGFSTHLDYEGDLHIDGYDSKTGDEHVFFETIADLIDPGTYIEWTGEDGTHWRWHFDGSEQMRTQTARIVWD